MGDWDWHIIDTMHKIDNNGKRAVQQSELYLTRRSDLDGKDAQKGGDVSVCTADPFFCTVETNTTV